MGGGCKDDRSLKEMQERFKEHYRKNADKRTKKGEKKPRK